MRSASRGRPDGLNPADGGYLGGYFRYDPAPAVLTAGTSEPRRAYPPRCGSRFARSSSSAVSSGRLETPSLAKIAFM